MNHLVHLFAQSASEAPELFEESPSDPFVNIALYILGMVLVIGVYALISYLLGRVFAKAGVASWKAWVPIYNNWILLKLGDQQGWWVIVSFIPFVGLIALIPMIIAYYNISRKFGKGKYFFLLGIFLTPIWIAWLALDDSTWGGNPTTTQPTPLNQNQLPEPPRFS